MKAGEKKKSQMETTESAPQAVQPSKECEPTPLQAHIAKLREEFREVLEQSSAG